MSNYLFLVHAPDRKVAVDRWVATHADDSEVHAVELTDRRRLVIVSRDVSASVNGDSYFRGTAVDSQSGTLVFGAAGWTAAPSLVHHRVDSLTGEFVAAHWTRSELHIDHDVFALARLLHTQAPGIAACSDSLFLLISLRRALGLPVTPNPEVLISRTPLSFVTTQQTSPDTMVDEVTFVPAGRGLRLSLRRLTWSLTGTRMAERVVGSSLPYLDATRHAATQVGRAVATLATMDGWRPWLSLSGGYDSRLIFAAIVASGRPERFNTGTTNFGAETEADVRIATGLAGAFGIRHSVSGNAAGASDADTGTTNFDNPGPRTVVDGPLTLWASGLAGTYDRWGVTALSPMGTSIPMTGFGAELLKGCFGWRTRKQMVEQSRRPGPAREALAAQVAKGMAAIGADPDITDASEIFYASFRNGLHCGAHVTAHMRGVHPLMTIEQAQLGHTLTSGRRRRPDSRFHGDPRAVADQTILLAPSVAAYPYDDPERNLSTAYVEDRLAELGGPLPPATDLFDVYGTPDQIPAGPSELALSVARSAGYVGSVGVADLLPRLSMIEAIADADVRAAFETMAKNLHKRLERGLTGHGVAPHLARVCLLAMLHDQ